MGQSTEELNSQIADTRGNLAADLDALQDKVSPAAIVARRKSAARERMSSVKSRVMGTAQGAGSAVGSSGSSAVDTVTGTARGAASSATDLTEGSPLAAGLVAFGAGMVVSALLPATTVEARAAHTVVDATKEHAQPLVDEARSAGQDVAARLKDSATESAQQIKDAAADSASRVQDEGRSSAETVRSEVTDQQ